MRLTWLMTDGSADRLRTGRDGPRNLLSAIRAQGHRQVQLRWDGKQVDVPDIFPDPVVAYGGHPFLSALAAARPDLKDGIFHDPVAHAFGVVHRHIGDLMLSSDPVHLSLTEAKDRIRQDGPMFLRPDLCEKAFSGGIYGADDLDALGGAPDLEVILARPVDIRAEYRIIVADGRPVTGSQYRRDSRLDIRIDVRDEALDAAARAAALYAPARIFTCDIAETDDGFRVIEYNSFSSSGLYACDGREIVRAVSKILTAEVDHGPAL